ncbi:nuclear transport factor 2 family protein [Streptomyces sp. SID11385]|uniref:nuclear transport factor 2 family protein n=1 Tax=Streptomyces sp. SID11385 TaxID=2706031 RepID=UPI0013C7329E|nr:nuclear transport factor 2 family protein [Streptomyces sp. SID11385]NEA44659.1 nuclear transport factor 2 family protein [Streptomyces sp. SID11385]
MNLEELSARAEIHDVLLRYCRGLDRVDMDLVRGVFHPDAYVRFPESLHAGSVDGFVAFLGDEMPRFVRTMHVLANSLIEFDGPDVAHVETYLNADHQGSERHHWKGDYVRLWGRYLDRFERRDGRWLIARRRLLVDWMYKYPADGWFDDHPDASVSMRDGSDPSLVPVAGFRGTPLAAVDWPG